MILTAQIIDEKSLIKKYQREISSLKQELDQLRRGMIGGASQEEIMSLRQQVCSICLIEIRFYIVLFSLKIDPVE
jgi:hypothetical protein